MKKLIEQIMKFGVVGFLCFFIDYFVLFAATEYLGINYLISSAISFSVSVIVNYILSIKFVFDTKKDTNKIKEFILFVVLSLIGLGINQIIMWFTVEKMMVYYMPAKKKATGP
ncbi:sugar translocase, partial [Lachnotalea glycerini]